MFKGKTLQLRRPGRIARNLSASNRKIAIAALIAAALWFFGDDLLHSLLHWLHLLLEVMESLLDDFFIEVLGLSHHSGEFATAYTGLAVALYLLFKLARRVYRAWMKFWAVSVKRYELWRETAQARWIARNWRLLATAAGALSLAYLLLL